MFGHHTGGVGPSSACFFLFGKHLRIKSFNGVWGTGMNFPTKANGQLTKAIPIETSQSSQLSLTVDVNFPRNSIIIT
jgi:hypothetical protein